MGAGSATGAGRASGAANRTFRSADALELSEKTNAGPSMPRRAAPAPSVTALATSLPTPSTPLIGRKRYIAAADHLLSKASEPPDGGIMRPGSLQSTNGGWAVMKWLK